jgi:hypothetical protein
VPVLPPLGDGLRHRRFERESVRAQRKQKGPAETAGPFSI